MESVATRRPGQLAPTGTPAAATIGADGLTLAQQIAERALKRELAIERPFGQPVDRRLPVTVSAAVIRALMRKYHVTIDEVAAEFDLTKKRVREARENGGQWDWPLIIEKTAAAKQARASAAPPSVEVACAPADNAIEQSPAEEFAP